MPELFLQGFEFGWQAAAASEPSVEGNHFWRLSFIQCNYGVVWDDSHATYVSPLLIWQNGNMNCFRSWCNMANVAQVGFSLSTFELNSGFWHTDNGFVLANVNGFTIADNKLFFTYGSLASRGIDIAGTSEFGNIHDNKGAFPGGINAIELGASTKNVDVHNNGFYGPLSNAVANAGTNNVVVMNNRILT